MKVFQKHTWRVTTIAALVWIVSEKASWLYTWYQAFASVVIEQMLLTAFVLPPVTVFVTLAAYRLYEDIRTAPKK